MMLNTGLSSLYRSDDVVGILDSLAWLCVGQISIRQDIEHFDTRFYSEIIPIALHVIQQLHRFVKHLRNQENKLYQKGWKFRAKFDDNVGVVYFLITYLRR